MKQNFESEFWVNMIIRNAYFPTRWHNIWSFFLCTYAQVLKKSNKIVCLFKERWYPNPKFNMFCALFQNYPHFFEKWYIRSIVWETQKWHYIFSRSSSFKLLTKTCKILFRSITLKSSPYQNFSCHFESLKQFAFFFHKKSVDNVEISHKTC